MSNKYKRLEGLADAIKEGFKHTNKARVEMSPDEELIKREARKMPPVSDKDIETITKRKSEEKKPGKTLPRVSDRDIKILEDKAKKSAKDPEEFLDV